MLMKKQIILLLLLAPCVLSSMQYPDSWYDQEVDLMYLNDCRIEEIKREQARKAQEDAKVKITLGLLKTVSEEVDKKAAQSAK